MKQTGYLIARSKAKAEFFTSSSSYDRPQWKGLAESTVYLTVEMAQNALTKLLKHGLSYEARLVPLQEVMTPIKEDMTFDFPNGERITTPHRGSAAETPGGNEFPKDDAVGDMTSDDEGGPCSECGHEPCTCEKSDEDGHCPHCGAELDSGHDEGDGDITEPEGEEPELALDQRERMPHEEEENAFSRSRFSRGQAVNYRGAKYEVQSDDGTGIAVIAPKGDPSASIRVDNTKLVKESEVKMPAKPAANAAPSDNDTTAANQNTKIDKVKFKNPAMTDAPVDFGGDNHDVRVKVPSEVVSELKAKIAEFAKEAEFSNTRDDAKASFLMTASEAMNTILAYLELGTVEGVKKAQISMTSMMSPIVNHIPPSVIKFISQGGKKSTLKDLFDAKSSEKKSVALGDE